MGRKSSISPEQGKALLDAYKRLGSKSAAAREIGVSEDAAMRYLADTPRAAAPAIASQQQVIAAAGASLFDTTDALETNFRKVQRLIGMLEAGIIEVKESASGECYETRVSPAILVSALREARGHIDSVTKLLELMISVNEVRRFQQVILDVITSEMDDATRERVFDQIRQRLPLGLLPR